MMKITVTLAAFSHPAIFIDQPQILRDQRVERRRATRAANNLPRHQ